MLADNQCSQFGEWLRHLRTSRRMSQVELARRCAIQASYLSALERNRRPPPLACVVQRIADGIGLEPGERDAALAHARLARQQWSTAVKTRKTGAEGSYESIQGVDPLVTFRCMLREAKRAAIEARATVEVASGQFRVVVRPERHQRPEDGSPSSPATT